jgi:hypothetical protein
MAGPDPEPSRLARSFDTFYRTDYAEVVGLAVRVAISAVAVVAAIVTIT